MNPLSSSEPPLVHADSYLTLHYRIELLTGPAAGSDFADTFLERPATLQLGQGLWSPGMEAALVGHREGEHFTVDIPAAEAYGERNPDLVQKVSLSMLAEHGPPDSAWEAGDVVAFTGPQGQRYSGVLKEMGAESALFDFNHPLAGIDLRLEILLMGVL